MNHRQRLLMAIVLLGLLAGCGTPGEPTAAPAIETIDPAPGTTAVPTAASAALATPIASPTVPPTPAGPQAVVRDVINQVDAHPLPQGAWETALENMLLYLGGEVWAKEEATARVGIGPDLVRVAPNTIFTFSQPDDDTMQIDLQQGQIWIDVEDLDPGEKFDVQTPSAVASVRGTRFSVRLAPDGSTVVSSQARTVTVSSAAGVVTLTAGLQTDVAPGQAPSSPVGMAVEEQARWGMAAGPGLDVVLPVNGETVKCFSFPLYASKPRLSRNGNWVALKLYDHANHKSLNKFYDLQAGAFFTPSLPAEAHVSFNPVDDSWAYSYYENTSQVCTAALDGSDTICAGGDGAYYGWPYWSPDGEWVLFYGDKGVAKGLNLFKLKRGENEMVQLTFSQQAYNVRQAWSPDGNQIAYVQAPEYSAAGDLWVMDADGSNPQRIFEGVQEGGNVAWGPTGDWLAVPTEVGGLWLLRPDGSEAHQVAGLGPGQYNDVDWSTSPSGWPLFFKFYDPDGRASLHYLSSDGTVPAYYGNLSWSPSWSADGRWSSFGYVEEVDPANQTYRSELCVLGAQPDFWP